MFSACLRNRSKKPSSRGNSRCNNPVIAFHFPQPQSSKQPDHSRVSNPEARNPGQTHRVKGCVSPVRAILAGTHGASSARCVGSEVVFEPGFDFALQFGPEVTFEAGSEVVLEVVLEVGFGFALELSGAPSVAPLP